MCLSPRLFACQWYALRPLASMATICTLRVGPAGLDRGRMAMTSAPAAGLSGCPRGNMRWLRASQRTVSGSGRPAGQRIGGFARGQPAAYGILFCRSGRGRAGCGPQFGGVGGGVSLGVAWRRRFCRNRRRRPGPGCCGERPPCAVCFPAGATLAQLQAGCLLQGVANGVALCRRAAGCIYSSGRAGTVLRAWAGR